MTLALADAARLSDADLARLLEDDPATFERLFGEVLAEGQSTAEAYERARQDWQLLYYTCQNPMAEAAHYSTAREVAISGGNRSGKTTTMLAEMAIQATGVIPEALKAKYPTSKIPKRFRGRVVGPSLTDWIEPILKPKLRYADWNGTGDPVDGRGHWGFIPRQLLRMMKWESAWNEKTRTLHIARDSSHLTGGVLTELREWGTLQVMSNDQDLSSFAGSSLTFVGHDEIPRPDIYRENQLRTLDVRGQIYTAFTPPDEIGASQGDSQYFYDTVYEPGLPGPNRNPGIEAFTIFTEANRILDPKTVRELWERLTPEQREVRFYGRFLHLAGAVFGSLWTPYEGTWCFSCARRVLATGRACPQCDGDDTTTFTHVIPDFDVPKTWPIVETLDPHPRKPSRVAWLALTPADDVLCVGNLAPAVVDAGVTDVVAQIRAFEAARGWRPVARIMDPNAAMAGNDMLEHGWNMRRMFDREGLRHDLGNDAVDPGVDRIREYLRPDRMTRRPRFQSFQSCSATNAAMGKWAYAEWQTRGESRPPKERYGEKFKDEVDCIRYGLMANLTFQGLRAGLAPLRVAAGGRY